MLLILYLVKFYTNLISVDISSDMLMVRILWRKTLDWFCLIGVDKLWFFVISCYAIWQVINEFIGFIFVYHAVCRVIGQKV